MDIGAYNFSGYPKWMYHATELPKQVLYPSEEEKLVAEGWSATYIVQEWPKAYFGPNGEVKNVANPEEAAALGPGWSDSPPAPDVQPTPPGSESPSHPIAGGGPEASHPIAGGGSGRARR